MKKFLLFAILALFSLKSDYLPWYSEYEPILMNRSDLEKSIKSVSVQAFRNPGKIYIKDTLLFVIEKFKGVHIIDDSNPANPLFIQFITVPGIVDIAVKGNTMYVDNAVDLVAVDITDVADVKELSRVKRVFPELTPPQTDYIPLAYQAVNRPAKTVIVEWVIKNEE